MAVSSGALSDVVPAGGMMGEMDRAEFERLRERLAERIQGDLQEATQLLSQLNHNLETWGERTGETQQLEQVWSHFQQQIVSLSDALGASGH
ncbi:DASH complex subunit dad1-like isoform X2 [Rana temporaria]|uniref:DASH complex subunit dad1-like isoform X2 n=1 Tax=Rana temporaria TaxID=8407 RepID=UPI001AACEDD5|nr:DASH complex subunit dad1-like isoform X2 [Rana temporaria]